MNEDNHRGRARERHTSDEAEQGHRDLVAQPHTTDEDGPIISAEAAAARASTTQNPLGKPGRRFDPRSPFMVGMAGAAGVAVTYGAIQAVIAVSQVLVLITVALFLAIGLEPVVSWLVRPWFPRWAAVTAVFVVAIGLLTGFLAAAIPPLVTQGSALVHNAPDYVHHLAQRYPLIDTLNTRFHLQDRVQQGVGS
uniref:AI-2E family transporter n=1 Tax=Nocardia vinacea TaxID=96468 RepID=UPI0012F689B7